MRDDATVIHLLASYLAGQERKSLLIQEHFLREKFTLDQAKKGMMVPSTI